VLSELLIFECNSNSSVLKKYTGLVVRKHPGFRLKKKRVGNNTCSYTYGRNGYQYVCNMPSNTFCLSRFDNNFYLGCSTLLFYLGCSTLSVMTCLPTSQGSSVSLLSLHLTNSLCP